VAKDQLILPRNYRWNFTAFTVDYTCFVIGMYFFGANTVVPSFIRQLTDSAPLVGLGGTLFSIGLMLPQLLAAKLVENKPRKHPFLVAALPGRALLILIAVALWSGLATKPSVVLPVFFVCLGLFAVTDAFVTVPWLDILARTIPANRRGRLTGLSQMLVGIAGIGAGAIISYILGESGPSFPNNYALLFAIAAAFLIPSTVALILLREPPPEKYHKTTQFTTSGRWLRFLTEDTNLRRLLACRLMLSMASLAIPFYVGHAQDILHLPGSIIGAFVTAQTIGSILASVTFGVISDRWGPRYVARIGSAALALAPLFALAIHAAGWDWLRYAYPLVYLILGAANSAYMTGFSNYLLVIAPDDARPTYVGLTNTILGLMSLLPTLGGWILENTSYIFLFELAAALGVIGFLLALRLRAPQPEASPKPTTSAERPA